MRAAESAAAFPPPPARTANISIHTTRSSRAPAHAAITSPPHFDPQQCDMNTVAAPTNGAISGSSA